MSIVSVNEDFVSRTGAWTVDEGRKYVRIFRVLMSSTYDGPNLAIQGCGVNRGDQYQPNGNEFEFDNNAYAHTLTATQEDGDGLGWLVVVEYGPYSSLWAGGGPTQNPLMQPIDVEWDWRTQEIVADIDVDGNPILNTAFDPFDPPLMEDDPRPLLTVVRNEPTFNVAQAIQYRNAVNSDAFGGFDPLFARCLPIKSKNLFHQDVGWYSQTTYQFEFRPATSDSSGQNGYRRTVLNQGMRALSTVTGVKYHPSYKGVTITEPILLNQSGYQIDKGEDPYYCIFQTKPELPFAVFEFDPDAISGARSGFVGGYGSPYYGGG